MAQSSHEGFPGKSDHDFSAAARDAVATAEEAGLLEPDEGGTVLRVVEMEVLVHGPIGEYRIVLGP